MENGSANPVSRPEDEPPQPDRQPPADAEATLSPDPALDSIQSMLATAVTENLEGRGKATITPRPTVAEQKPPSLLGDFRIVSKIGEGAMGTVYKGYQVSAQREVAVKILFPHMARNHKLLERFYREARSMGHLNHPNIVQGFAVGEEQGWHYLAMEFVDGRSLQKWLGLLGRLSVGDSLHIVLACADGLQYAHDLELIHRDVKPDNILITRQGQVKLTDLGAVKWLDEDVSLTQTGHGIGTPCYMPLEQARNAKEADGRSDIYALGCVLYCLLTGKPPFNGSTIVELIMAKDIGRFTPARRYNPAIPERLDLIIDKMIAKQVKYRYQTCAEVIRDLRSLHLGNSALSFIPPASDPNLRTVLEATTTIRDAPPPVPATAPKPTPPEFQPRPRKVVTPPPAPVDAEAPPTATGGDTVTGKTPVPAEVWYVKYRGSGGMVSRRLSTAQVNELIYNPAFDPTTVISRSPTEGFRFLTSFREFEATIAARTARKSGETRSARHQSIYKQLAEEDQQRHQEREAIQDMSEWPMYLYRLAVLAVAAGFGFVILRVLFKWLSGTSVD